MVCSARGDKTEFSMSQIDEYDYAYTQAQPTPKQASVTHLTYLAHTKLGFVTSRAAHHDWLCFSTESSTPTSHTDERLDFLENPAKFRIPAKLKERQWKLVAELVFIATLSVHKHGRVEFFKVLRC